MGTARGFSSLQEGIDRNAGLILLTDLIKNDSVVDFRSSNPDLVSGMHNCNRKKSVNELKINQEENLTNISYYLLY